MPQRTALRCEIRHRGAAFEAAVVDISLGGVGTLVYDAAVRIDPGALLDEVRLVLPGHAPIPVDMEVRHVARVTLPDGRPANRAGCRIFGEPGEIETLVRLFLAELGK